MARSKSLPLLAFFLEKNETRVCSKSSSSELSFAKNSVRGPSCWISIVVGFCTFILDVSLLLPDVSLEVSYGTLMSLGVKAFLELLISPSSWFILSSSISTVSTVYKS